MSTDLAGDDRSTDLADSQFDYPGQAHGWSYYVLNEANEFAPLQPLSAAQGTATPLTCLGCDDPHAFIARDALHPGYERRPCIQWHPLQAGAYLITGEIALTNFRAAGAVHVQLIVDDVVVLVHDLVYPQVLDFELEIGVRDGGFVRVLFSSVGSIDYKETLYYLRARHARASALPSVRRLTFSCGVPPAWQHLAQRLGQSLHCAPQDLAHVAQNLFEPVGQADPQLVLQLQAGAQQRFQSKLEGFLSPRFFTIQAPSTAQIRRSERPQ